MKTIIFLFCIFFFACDSNSVTDQGLSHLGFYNNPKNVIKKIKPKLRSIKKEKYYRHFMLGAAYKKKKQYKKAIYHFTNSCFIKKYKKNIRLYPLPVYSFVDSYSSKSAYYSDAVFEIAHLFYMYNEHTYVIKFIDLIPQKKSCLYRNAKMLQARSYIRLKKYNKAEKILQSLLEQYIDNKSQALIYIRLGSLYLKKDANHKTLNTFLKAIDTTPSTWQASVAARQVVRILPQLKISLSEEKKIIVAKALYSGRQYSQSLNILYSLRQTKQKDVIMYTVKSLVRLKRFRSATRLIRKLKKDRSFFITAYTTMADELWSMRWKRRAVSIYRQVLRFTSQPDKHSLRRICKYYKDRKYIGFDRYLKLYIKHFPRDLYSGRYLWSLGRHALRSNNRQAMSYFLLALKRFPHISTSANCRFWLYRLYASTDKKQSLQYAMQLVNHNPGSSYTWRMLKQLQSSFSIEQLERLFKKAYKEDHNKKAHFYHTLLFIKEKDISIRNERLDRISLKQKNIYEKLANNIATLTLKSKSRNQLQSLEPYFVIGYRKGIRRELSIIPEDTVSLMDKYIALTHFSNTYKYYHLAIASLRKVFSLLRVKEDMSLLPQSIIMTLLPKPFMICVEKYSRMYDIDPLIVYSVVKAESFFNPRAVSSAGAVGLMQLMPATARGIGRQLGTRNYDLKDPCTSIHFGTKYISWLKKFFKGKLPLMIAGYNAGAGNVKKWKRRRNINAIDRFIEFMPFIETRYYVIRTDKFYLQYKTIYKSK